MLKNLKKEKVLIAVAGFILIAFLILLSWNNFFVCRSRLDSDMASELILEQSLSERNQMFHSGWYYSTELRILNTLLVRAPLFKIFSDWTTVRTVGNALLFCFMLCSYLVLLKYLKVDLEFSLLTAAMLLCPFSRIWLNIMYEGAYYIPHVTITFFYLTLFLMVEKTGHEANRIKKRGILAGYLLLSVILGMSGIRYMLNIQLPILMTSALLVLFNRNYQEIREKPTAENLKKALKWKPTLYFLLSLIGAAVTVLGYFISERLLSRVFRFHSYSNNKFKIFSEVPLLTQFSKLTEDLLGLLGYSQGVKLFSLQGIRNIAVLLLLLLFILMFIKILNTKNLSYEKKFTAVFFISSFLISSATFILLDTYTSRYYIPVLAAAVPAAAIYWQEEEKKLDRIFIGGGCIAAALIIGLLVWKEYAFDCRDNKNNREDVLAYLLDNDLTFGYATFWNGNVLTELSNGEVEVAGVSTINKDSISYFQWLTFAKYHEPGYHEGKVFILLAKSELETFQSTELSKEGELAYQDSGYTVYVFQDNQPIYSRIAGIMNGMATRGQAEKLEPQAAVIRQGGEIYRDDIKQNKGTHYLMFFCDTQNADQAGVKIRKGDQVLAESKIHKGFNRISFKLKEPMENISYEIYNNGPEEMMVFDLNDQ
ncbi:hypothetical protein C814_01807 [Anaerotruncus sp. G3(2012)]|uniref:hypothetical protein n=1 Tax=Anaerotruncus sp. G3(2012) TaxID=1235835 RepID=UPI000335C526|nr:hypothetical protein [Anaerotruncus sp. G3(2012)]EOS59755.1 hypothetical protein C814_01807 [Anaerotruncus sp. G3(2012)]